MVELLADQIFTPERISRQAQINVTALTLGAIKYLKDNELSHKAFWESIGHSFAKAWAPDSTAREILNRIALNIVSGQGTLLSMMGTDTWAEAKFEGFPSEQAMELFDLTADEAYSAWHVFAPIADFLGYEYSWQRNDNIVTITINSR